MPFFKSVAYTILAGLIFALIILSSVGERCKVSDFQPSGFNKSYRAATKELACEKAITMCTYYSYHSKKCAVVDN